MKKTVMIVFALCLVMVFGYKVNNLEAQREIKVFVDNQKVLFSDELPIIKNSRILVPLRTVQEHLNASVHWDAKNSQVISHKKTNEEQLTLIYNINSPYVYKEFANNVKEKEVIKKIDVPVIIKNQRTMIPLRSSAETFGYEVRWDKENYTAFINTNDKMKFSEKNFDYEVDGNVSELEKIELEIFYLTNKEREKAGLKPLILDIENSKVAKIKSKDLHDYEYFSHNSERLGTPFEMMQQYGIEYIYAGENLAAGYVNASDVIEGWMDSPGHRKNILRPEFERVGLGYYKGSKGYQRYFTQLFSTK